MSKHKVSAYALIGCAALVMSGCKSAETGGHVPVEYYSGTTLDRNAIGVRQQTQYLEVNLNPQDSQLRLPEIAKVKGFLASYNANGHGPLVISLPKNADNPQLAVGAAAETRELAWEAGIDYEQIMGAAYDARGRRGSPLIMAFKSFEAVAPDCPSLSEVDFSNAISNNDQPSLGCAIRTNMAAMIAEPADLFGDRELSESDISRREIQLQLWRDGAVTAAARSDNESAALSTAVN